MTGPNATEAPISARAAAILIAIAVIAFGAILVLAGWAPELRQRNEAGEHPYSTSAIGYNGLVRLLEAQGYPVRISRLEKDLTQRPGGLMIVTAPANRRLPDLDASGFLFPTLLVLPKWEGRADPMDPSRQIDTRFLEASLLNDRLSRIWPDAEIVRISPDTELATPFGPRTMEPDVRLQLIRSASLQPFIQARGGTLVGYDHSRQIYVLTDPDLLNTFGLARLANARLATELLTLLRGEDHQPILLDASLHGFERSENLLKMLFSAPFLGATLAAIAAALLLGWAGAVRFGPPSREGRAIALGKQALADNSAGLVTMARRETNMAPGYAALIRRRLSAALGLPRNLTDAQITEMFDRFGPAPGSEQAFSDLEAGLREPATSRDALVERARNLYHWHKAILRRTLHERG
ncbi:DUF4350 domain-containing protein [Hyphomonas sp.]|uniref:DUF4350 domain-containing protein n=1 Tax=Hyphomonas sp. TaxID=87 RepID=UPI00391BAF63